MGLTLMAFGCIERYLLIFHRIFFNKHLLVLHYGPIFVCFIYPPILYFGLIVLYSCQTDFDYTQSVCGGPCYEYEFAVGLYDWFSNVCAPVVIGAIVTTTLIVRVLLQKRRVNQQQIWRRNRRIVVQLASISIMYAIVWIPSVLCFVIPLIATSPLAEALTVAFFNYFQYVSCLLCPFMCLIGLPEVRNSLMQMFIRSNAVQPTNPNRTIRVTALPHSN